MACLSSLCFQQQLRFCRAAQVLCESLEQQAQWPDSLAHCRAFNTVISHTYCRSQGFGLVGLASHCSPTDCSKHDVSSSHLLISQMNYIGQRAKSCIPSLLWPLANCAHRKAENLHLKEKMRLVGLRCFFVFLLRSKPVPLNRIFTTWTALVIINLLVWMSDASCKCLQCIYACIQLKWMEVFACYTTM